MTAAEPTHLDRVIDQLLTKLEEMDPETTEYAHVVDQLTKLTNLVPKKDPLIKPEALLMAGTNLAGILAILNFERVNVITSKAIGFVLKSRL